MGPMLQDLEHYEKAKSGSELLRLFVEHREFQGCHRQHLVAKLTICICHLPGQAQKATVCREETSSRLGNSLLSQRKGLSNVAAMMLADTKDVRVTPLVRGSLQGWGSSRAVF